MERKILIIIDAQNDFINGSLGTKEAVAAVDNIVSKIEEFDGDTIVCTLDTHSEDYFSTKEGKRLPVKHCIKGTYGWEISGKITDAINRKIEESNNRIQLIKIEKPTFGSEKLIEHMTGSDEGDCFKTDYRIMIVGFCTDICVISNVLMIKAHCYENSEITVASSCCAGVTPETHKAALDVMRSCQINVID